MNGVLYLIASIAVFYLVVNVSGFFIEKIKIPKIYAALFLGVIFGATPLVKGFVATGSIKVLSQTGMFMLLFLLGFGLNLSEMKKQGGLIIRITAAVIISEFVLGALILHYYFNVTWLLSGIIAVSFATVGEVALLPILKEFKLIQTKLGQTIFGVAILDDVAEILAFVLLFAFVTGFQLNELFNSIVPLLAIGLGVVAGHLLRHSEKVDKIVSFITLFIFGPFFFFVAGTEADFHVFLEKFWVILAITLAIKATKITSAYLTSHKELGTKKSIVLGVSLGIKFSTSIIILIILLQRGLITEEVFSVLIGIKILFKFIVPIVLSILLSRWHLDLVDEPNYKQSS